jgi:hypothetical protein
MTPHELEVLALSTAKLIKSAVAEATAPLLTRVEELEAVHATLTAQMASMTTRMAGMETKALAPMEGPPGPAGPAGEPGAKGDRGDNGIDGRDGIDGKDGRDGLDGIHGKDGANGRDGVGIADALIDKDHSLVLTLTDGTVKKLGVVVGRDGVNGQKGDPGRDGFGFDDLSAEFDGDRLLTLAFVRGEDRKAFPVELPHTIYRGVFADGTVYQRGDAVTWGGSLWIAKERTTDKPEVSKAWQLAVKRGRDGREGKSGPEGPRGPKGDKGDR